jgi:hypothetical protein
VKKVVIGPTRRSAALSPGRAAAAAPPVDGDPATTPWLMPDLQPMPEQSAIGAQPGPRTRLAAFSPPSPVLGGGRGQCAAAGPGSGTRYRFEDPEPGVSVAQFYMLSFSMPRIDSTHSWCGRSSLRVDATFHENGRRNFFGRLPYQTGQVIVQLPRSVDFSGKTVTMQVFVEGPSDVRVSALPVVIHRGAWVPGEMLENVAPDRWWTVSSRFEKENPIPGGTTSGVFDCNRVALIIYNSGKDRGRQTWNGAVYVDEIAWR